jgi:hypothetical protein
MAKPSDRPQRITMRRKGLLRFVRNDIFSATDLFGKLIGRRFENRNNQDAQSLLMGKGGTK